MLPLSSLDISQVWGLSHERVSGSLTAASSASSVSTSGSLCWREQRTQKAMMLRFTSGLLGVPKAQAGVLFAQLVHMYVSQGRRIHVYVDLVKVNCWYTSQTCKPCEDCAIWPLLKSLERVTGQKLPSITTLMQSDGHKMSSILSTRGPSRHTHSTLPHVVWPLAYAGKCCTGERLCQVR